MKDVKNKTNKQTRKVFVQCKQENEQVYDLLVKPNASRLLRCWPVTPQCIQDHWQRQEEMKNLS